VRYQARTLVRAIERFVDGPMTDGAETARYYVASRRRRNTEMFWVCMSRRSVGM